MYGNWKQEATGRIFNHAKAVWNISHVGQRNFHGKSQKMKYTEMLQTDNLALVSVLWLLLVMPKALPYIMAQKVPAFDLAITSPVPWNRKSGGGRERNWTTSWVCNGPWIFRTTQRTMQHTGQDKEVQPSGKYQLYTWSEHRLNFRLSGQKYIFPHGILLLLSQVPLAITILDNVSNIKPLLSSSHLSLHFFYQHSEYTYSSSLFLVKEDIVNILRCL